MGYHRMIIETETSVDGRLDPTQEQSEDEDERREEKSAARVFENIILISITYHLLKLILQYLITYRASHLKIDVALFLFLLIVSHLSGS